MQTSSKKGIQKDKTNIQAGRQRAQNELSSAESDMLQKQLEGMFGEQH